MEHLSDDRLLTLTPSEPAAFAVFYRRHERPVLAFLRSRTGDAELAADLAAETFAAALVGARRFRPGREPALAWLFGIARNKWLHARRRGAVEDRARRRLRMEPLVLDDDDLERIDRLATTEWATTLLEALPAEQEQAVRARVVEERSYEQIAATMRCSPSVVRKRVSRGLGHDARRDRGGVMSAELPELERPDRRRGRAPLRRTAAAALPAPRLSLVAGLVAAAAAVVLVIAIFPLGSDEQAASPATENPASALAKQYGIFARGQDVGPRAYPIAEDQLRSLAPQTPVAVRMLRSSPDGGIVAVAGTGPEGKPAVCFAEQTSHSGGGGCIDVADLPSDEPWFVFGVPGRTPATCHGVRAGRRRVGPDGARERRDPQRADREQPRVREGRQDRLRGQLDDRGRSHRPRAQRGRPRSAEALLVVELVLVALAGPGL